MVNTTRSGVPAALAAVGLMVAALLLPAVTPAQSEPEEEIIVEEPIVTEEEARAISDRTATLDDRRFIQIFTYDAAVVENFWIEGQVRLTSDPDSFRVGPVFAWSPIDRLEIGGRIDYLDWDEPGGGSGLSDMDVWAKWQIFHNPVQFSVGLDLSLPTGKEEDFLGTGEFDIGVFGSVRKNLEQAYITGYFGIRANSDAKLGPRGTPLEVNLDGDTSIFLGGGVMFPLNDRFSLSGELQVETERYKGSSSFIDLTVGAFWYVTKKTTLRGGLAFGLEDAAPDFELTVGFAWHF